MRKRLRLKKMVSALLAVAMIGQSCLVTTAGDLTDDAAIVAMQEQAAAEEAAARKAAASPNATALLIFFISFPPLFCFILFATANFYII